MKKLIKLLLSFISISIIFVYINTAQAIILNNENDFVSEISYNFLDDTNAFIINPKDGTKLFYEDAVEMFANYEKTIKTIADNNNTILENPKEKISTGDKIQINTDEQFTAILYGDATGDGEICTEKDVEVIKNDYLNREKSVSEYKMAADLCTDGKLNVKDIQKMLLKRKGKLTEGIVDEFLDNQGIHNAIFVVDDVEIAKVKFTLKDGLLNEKPAIPEKIGYKAEWEQYELLEEDIIIKAIYSPNEYEIIYETDGGNFKDNPKLTYTVENFDIELPIPKKENFVFEGWYETVDFAGAKIESLEGKIGNLTLYAKYIDAKYKTNLNDYYLTLKDAISSANELTTVTSILPLVDTVETESITFTGTQILTLNLNGKTIMLDDAKITNNKNLNISGSGILEIISGTNLITNKGVLTLSSGTIKSTGTNAILNVAGTTVVSGGYIEVTNGHGINNLLSGTVELTGGTIKVNTDTKSGILNYSTGTIQMSDGEIIGVGNGICNAASGVINIMSGKIDVSGSYAVNGNTGIVVIGINEVIPEVCISNPNIKGANIGLQINDGTLKIYDGIVKGALGKSIVGDVAECASGYVITKEFEIIEDVEYETSILVPSKPEFTLESEDEIDTKEDVEVNIEIEESKENIETDIETEDSKENIEVDTEIEELKENIEINTETNTEDSKENIEIDTETDIETEDSRENIEVDTETEESKENIEADTKIEESKENIETDTEIEESKENIEVDTETEDSKENIEVDTETEEPKENIEADTETKESKENIEIDKEIEEDNIMIDANIEIEESQNTINNLSALDTELQNTITENVIISVSIPGNI